MTERMSDERFKVLFDFAMHPQMKPWIAEMADAFKTEREYAEHLQGALDRVVDTAKQMPNVALMVHARNWSNAIIKAAEVKR